MLKKVKNKINQLRYYIKFIFKYTLHKKEIEFCLIDTPVHGNLGDQAIVLAEQQILQANGMEYNELTAWQIDKCEKWYARLISKNQTVVVHGGGFLGSLWPWEEYRFRRILEAFREHRIIVFPQTVTFDLETDEGIKFFEESKRIYSAHPNLTIFVREKKSFDYMSKNMPTVKCILVPDLVTILETNVKAHKRQGVLLCMRKDKEKVISESEYSNIIEQLKQRYRESDMVVTDTVLNHAVKPPFREEEVQKKLEEFACAELVVTDRLHGMIFAAITNTPCIALGNCNGKVKAVYEWIKNNTYVKYLDDSSKIGEVISDFNFQQEYHYNNNGLKKAFVPLLDVLLKK